MTEPLSHDKQTSARATTSGPAEDGHGPDPLAYRGAGEHTGMEIDHDSPPGTPRWVKGLGIIFTVLVLVFAALHVTGNAPAHMAGSSGTQHGMQAP